MQLNRILVLHNRYRESGGEDHAFAQEVALLRARGHKVTEYVDTNERLDDSRLVSAGIDAVWSRDTVRRLDALIRDTRPDVAHFHNTFLMISPAAYYACRRARIPVVQTLHNFRFGCLSGYCALGGQPCENCFSSRFAWPGIRHGCYHGSWAASAAVAGIGAVHRTIGTYRRQVDAYISPSEFARQVHLRAGVPARLSFLKPNFAAASPAATAAPGGYAFCAGRLVGEKGTRVLLEAWRQLKPSLQLKVAGDGPDADELHAAFGDLAGVEFLGAVPRERVLELMVRADFYVQPSLSYETCGIAVIEAMSAGVPPVVTGHGAFAELVEDGRSGLHVRPGDVGDLAAKLGWMLAHPEQRARMGHAARERFELHYSPDTNYGQLIDIYEAARRNCAAKHA